MLRKLFIVGTCLAIALSLFGVASWRMMIWMSGNSVNEYQRHHPELAQAIAELSSDLRQLSEPLVPRSSENLANLTDAAKYIEVRFTENGYIGVSKQNYRIQNQKFFNVWTHNQKEIPKTGAIIVGAHYDAFERTPGANDNASGVSALLYLAKKLKQEKVTAPFIFVAFANEEPPHFGTKAQGARQFAKLL